MSGGGAETGATFIQEVVGTVRGECVGDANSGLGGGTGRGRRGYGWGGDRDRLIQWEDTVANLTLGTEPNAPLSYAPGL